MKTAIIKLTSAFLSAVRLTGCGSDLIVKVENAKYRNYFSDSRTVSIDLSDDISSADISLGTALIILIMLLPYILQRISDCIGCKFL